MNCEICMFDLDGTLSNPKLGILICAQYALKHVGIEIEDSKINNLVYFIGPPLRQTFAKHFQLNESQVEIAVEKFRERMGSVGFLEAEIYQGVPQMLKKLKRQGNILALATSKENGIAEQVLKHFDLYKYFDFVAGASVDNSRDTKTAVMEYALNNLDPKRKKSVVMVGDMKYDIIGAKNLGTNSIGVTYGYGTKEELVAAGADNIAKTVKELQSLLLG